VKAHEEAEIALTVAEQVLLDRTAVIDSVKRDNAEYFAQCIAEHEAGGGEIAVRLLSEMDDTFAVLSQARQSRAWLNDGKPPGPFGSKYTNLLEQELRDTVNPPRFAYVSQAAHRQLREGKDVLDTSGSPVTVEDVQTRRDVVKIAHSTGLRDSPVGRVSDRG
jgi:hypothetical protein